MLTPDYTSKDGQITLYRGDCLEVMFKLPELSCDMLLCDPPYGVTSMSWDFKLPLFSFWEGVSLVCKGNSLLFSVQPFTTDLIISNRKQFKYSLVWSKNVPTGMAQAKNRPMRYHEDILLFYGGKYNPQPKLRVGEKKQCYQYAHYCGPNNHLALKKVPKKYDPDYVLPGSVLDFKVVPNRSGKLHPTQKPVDLCEYLVKTYSDQGDTVLDSFCGSGTTAVACLNTGRNFIGIEKEQKYFDIAVRRVEDWYKTKAEAAGE